MTHLWNNGQPVPESVETKSGNIDSVYGDMSLGCLHDAEQTVGQTRLAGSCSAHNANL